ncbi:hypothetical protein JZ751_006589 [Albula glossodonta]|uniref:Uncharacterized protein n=1 Tax=Albula glossodonta TaxID=121402 RepID=A0A8T2NAN8_9TELE|nr:hypothetical protein JZ751_006589 [Albula glossodonta]
MAVGFAVIGHVSCSLRSGSDPPVPRDPLRSGRFVLEKKFLARTADVTRMTSCCYMLLPVGEAAPFTGPGLRVTLWAFSPHLQG